MRIYAETNWLLDLTFQQERFAASAFVLSLAQSHQIDLCLPEIIVGEGDQKVERRNAQRRTIIEGLGRERREFGRSQEALYQARYVSLEPEIEGFKSISDLERRRFDQIIEELLPIATWLHLSQEIWVKCFDLQDGYGLKRTDALIYAIICADAALHPDVEKCLINYDRVFDDPELKQEMSRLGITLLASAEAVTGFLQSRI